MTSQSTELITPASLHTRSETEWSLVSSLGIGIPDGRALSDIRRLPSEADSPLSYAAAYYDETIHALAVRFTDLEVRGTQHDVLKRAAEQYRDKLGILAVPGTVIISLMEDSSGEKIKYDVTAHLKRILGDLGK